MRYAGTAHQRSVLQVRDRLPHAFVRVWVQRVAQHVGCMRADSRLTTC